MQTRLIAGALSIAIILAIPWLLAVVRPAAPVRLGILHSLTGSLAASERPLVDAELMAVEELNRAGGVLGRPVQAVVVDARSDDQAFAAGAEELVQKEQVSAILGGWTTGARKAIKAVVERHNHLLVFPVAHEGLELSENVVYTGAAPNQRIVPAVKWSFDNLGRRFFLLGADDIRPHTLNAIVRDQLRALGGELAGEAYVRSGSANVGPAAREIVRTRPTVLISALSNDSNRALFAGLRAEGLGPDRLPHLSLALGEVELGHLPAAEVAGVHAAWSYLQELPGEANRTFVARFRARFGAGRVTSDAIQTAYASVHLWAQAAREAGTDSVAAVRKSLCVQSHEAPEGVISIDPATHHAWRSFAIGRVRADGGLEPVWVCRRPIRPVPYPPSRTRPEWEAYLLDRFTAWGGAWANPVHEKW